MMPIKVGAYQVHKFFHMEKGYLCEYFTPTDTMNKKLAKEFRVMQIKSQGYVPFGIVFVDEETYINMRINDTVDEYLYEDYEEQECRKKYRNGYVNPEGFKYSMQTIKEYKWVLMKKLDKQMSRLRERDFNCYNEVAMQLNDQFLRGLTM